MLLGFAVIGSITVLESMHIGMTYEQKALADLSATGCMEQALESLGVNHAYAGNETKTFNSIVCSIRPVLHPNGYYVVETQAAYGLQNVFLRVTVPSVEPMTVSTWDEISSF